MWATALAAGVAMPCLAAGPAGAPARVPPKLTTSSTALPISSATSLLVVSPHPDDETLCCSGVMQRVLKAGGRVSIV